MTHPVGLSQTNPKKLVTDAMQVPPLDPDEDDSQMNEDITRDTETREGGQTEQCAVTNRKCDISHNYFSIS